MHLYTEYKHKHRWIHVVYQSAIFHNIYLIAITYDYTYIHTHYHFFLIKCFSNEGEVFGTADRNYEIEMVILG